jgi:hypothetical protein
LIVRFDGQVWMSHGDHWHDASTGERIAEQPAGRSR